MTAVAQAERGEYKVISGNHAAAYGAKLARVEVISAYPISPQTQIVEKLADFVSTGDLRTRFINVESEHSVMGALIGAATAGARTFTATAGQGLALMHEPVQWVGRGRLPVVMVVVNRALGAPWHLGSEQDDSLAVRDAPWIQLYCETSQEVLDSVIQAFKIAEQVSLPAMVVEDAFYLGHTAAPVHIPNIELVDQYLPKRETECRLDPSRPLAFFQNLALTSGGPELITQFRRQAHAAMIASERVAEEADREFGRVFGRSYGLIEAVDTRDAELILVSSGTITSTARAVIASCRQKGQKIGLLKIRSFRPFPREAIVKALGNVPKVAVVDRNLSCGRGGVFAIEVRDALYHSPQRPTVFGFVAGLGGMDVTPKLVAEMVDYALNHEQADQNVIWMGGTE